MHSQGSAEGKGFTDGSFRGHRFFHCNENCGVFVPGSRLERDLGKHQVRKQSDMDDKPSGEQEELVHRPRNHQKPLTFLPRGVKHPSPPRAVEKSREVQRADEKDREGPKASENKHEAPRVVEKDREMPKGGEMSFLYILYMRLVFSFVSVSGLGVPIKLQQDCVFFVFFLIRLQSASREC